MLNPIRNLWSRLPVAAKVAISPVFIVCMVVIIALVIILGFVWLSYLALDDILTKE